MVDNVKRIYRRQFSVMRDKLDGWWVSDGDVDRVMAVLDPLPVEDAAALVRALGSGMRVRLVGNVSGSHRRNFRRSVLASYAGLTWAELKYFDQGLFSGLSLVQLGVQERFLAVLALLNMRDETGASGSARRAARPSSASSWPAARRTRPSASPSSAQRAGRRSSAAARRRTGSRTTRARDAARDAPAAAARPDRDGGAGRPRPARAARPPRCAGETPVATTAEPPADAPAAPAPPARAGGAHGRDGAARAVRRGRPPDPQPPRAATATSPAARRDAFLAVLRARPVDANVRLAISLLDTGLFSDWWVTDAEARLAYDIVQSLPLDARDSFFRRDNSAWLDKLEENLPEDVLGRADFADFSIRDENGRLVDVGARRAETLRGREGSRVLADVLRSVERERGRRAPAASSPSWPASSRRRCARP